jgi:hypothetical protein
MSLPRATTPAVPTILVTAMVSQDTYGDGIVRRAAPDGSWARFYCTEKWTDGTERTTDFTIKAVGSTTVDGQPARWIELKFVDGMKPEDQGPFLKLLIPAKSLEPGEDPLKNTLKAWRKSRDRNAIELKDKDVEFLRPRMALFLSPPIKGVKKTDKTRTVDWQGGQLVCEVFEGTARFEHRVDNSDWHCLLSVHDKVPFEVAAATIEITNEDGNKGTLDFQLADFGTDAKSDGPDLQ